jgi:thiosulfate/3-mercaptopyruvate sulfurtransferase
MTMLQLILASTILASAASTPPRLAYPRADLLIEAKDLARPGQADKFRILDVRTANKYQAGHVPPAVRVDHDAWARAFANQPDDQLGWSRRMGALGIPDIDKAIVVYSDDPREAARIWWILRFWGLNHARLLNGGWQAWQAAGGPVAQGAGEHASATSPKLMPQPARLATKSQLLKDLQEKHFAIIDTRSDGEYCGDVKLAKRVGAIPGAKHLEWTEVIDKKTQRFKSAPELAKLFADAGIDLKRPTVTHCQSGGRASVTAFALELMGARDVRNYYRSWAEWGNAEDTPVVRPQKK